MTSLEILLTVGFCFSATIAFVLFRRQQRLRIQNFELEFRLGESQRRLEEYKLASTQNQIQLEQTFRSLAADALDKNAESFLKLASERLDKKTVEAKSVFEANVLSFRQLVDPLKETLSKVETDLLKVEKERSEQFGRISMQLVAVTQSSEGLRKEASSLSSALRRPEVRGSWGEIQLKRVVELAGMSAYCDFEEQVSIKKDGSVQRPDMIVRLPNQRVLVVDSKAVLDAFLDAVEASEPEVKRLALERHARNMRTRVADLAKKSYWEQFEHAPDFAVLFIPNEALLASAVEVDRNLIEDALSERVVIATPTTLVALLKAVAYGWQQEKVAENATKVMTAAREFYDRVQPWAKHFQGVGEKLSLAVKSYNQCLSSMESRVLPSVRRMNELGIREQEPVAPLNPVEEALREPRSDISAPDVSL